METKNNNWCCICGQKKNYPEHNCCRWCNKIYLEQKGRFSSRKEWKKYILEHPEIRARIVLYHLGAIQMKEQFLTKKAANILRAIETKPSEEVVAAS